MESVHTSPVIRSQTPSTNATHSSNSVDGDRKNGSSDSESRRHSSRKSRLRSRDSQRSASTSATPNNDYSSDYDTVVSSPQLSPQLVGSPSHDRSKTKDRKEEDSIGLKRGPPLDTDDYAVYLAGMPVARAYMHGSAFVNNSKNPDVLEGFPAFQYRVIERDGLKSEKKLIIRVVKWGSMEST